MTDTVLYERRGKVALITLNRPDRLNAMDQPMLVELLAALDAAEADPETGAVVVTGAGRGFSAGFDLQSSAAAPPLRSTTWVSAKVPPPSTRMPPAPPTPPSGTPTAAVPPSRARA